MEVLAYLREFNLASIALRLVLAVVCGGLIGLERERKRRAAGFRTYMLVSLGATLAMLLGQYEAELLDTVWSTLASALGVKTDVSRFGAQVINGIGFLGAGTTIVNTGKQEVKGLTTAAGLWASACMGLAIGAGFYACVLLAFLLIVLSMRVLARIENHIIDNARNMNLYVEFQSLDDVGRIIGALKAQGVHIYEVDINHGHEERFQNPSAVFSLQLREKRAHTQLVASMMDLQCIRLIEEI